MLQKGSFIKPSDKGSIKLLKVINVYRTRRTKHAIFGKFLKCILKVVAAKFTKIRKKKTKGIVVRSNINIIKKDSISIKFSKNAVIPLKRRMNPWNKKLLGPTLREFKLKKFRLGLSSLISNKKKIFFF